MGWLGMLPAWLAVLVVGRDTSQVAGMFWFRFRMFGGRWPGATAFFDVDRAVVGLQPVRSEQEEQEQEQDEAAARASAGDSTNMSGRGSSSSSKGGGAETLSTSTRTRVAQPSGPVTAAAAAAAAESAPRAAAPPPAAGDSELPVIRPLLVSKANTALVLLLVGGCMGHQWLDLPSQEVLDGLEVMTAGTTLASAAAYAWLHWQGRLLAVDANKPQAAAGGTGR